MARYSFLAADLVTKVIREEVPLTRAAFSSVLCGAGGFEAEAPLYAPARFVDPVTEAEVVFNPVTASVLDPGRTRLYVLRDGVPLWSGLLWAVSAEMERNRLSIAGQGTWSYFHRRELEVNKTYAATEQFTIVQDLIDYAQAQTGGDVDLNVAWTAASGITRDRTYYGYEQKNIAQAIEQLAAVEQGFDFGVDLTGSVAAGFTETLNLSYPRRGRRTALVFETQKNVRVLRYTRDAWTMANRHAAIGAGEGSGMLLARAADVAALTAYPLLQGSSAHKDVSVFKTLSAHAKAELARNRNGSESLQVEVLPDEVDAALGSFIAGDEVLVRANRGYLDLDAYYRVMSYGVRVDATTGRETLQAELTRAEETVA